MTDYKRSDRMAYAGPAFTGQPEYNREEINRTRQAAEALFAPKRRVAEPATPATASTADQTARKPRILSAVRVQPTPVKSAEVTGAGTPPKPVAKIPASHLGRIRTWLRYGMTKAQVAEVYRVTTGDIESMLQKA
jgi:hypothetical protein